MLYKPLYCFAIFVALTSVCISPAPSIAKTEHIRDTSWQKTYDLYSEVPCLTQDELEFGAEVIAGLSYNSSRVFRKLSEMQGIDFIKSKQAWVSLTSLGLSYEQVLVFEEWSDLGQIHIDLALTALLEISTLNYEAGKSFRSYSSLPQVSPEHALKTIPLLNRLNDAQNRAIQQLLALPEINAEQALDGLGQIARMSYYQSLAVEALEKIPTIKIDTVIDALPLIRMLNMENAWNAKTLFSAADMTPDNAWYWLVSFFANPTKIQEKQFYTLTNQEKVVLVESFYNGGEELIWKINNLHGVTDRFGLEISNYTLHKYSTAQIREHFERLSPQIKSDF